MINVDDSLLDGLWITAFVSELRVQDRAVDTLKIKFSTNRILAGMFIHDPHSR